MPKLYTITNEWTEQQWFSTGGTRAKKYLQGPDGRFYYFKRSQYKQATAAKAGKDFKYEFWNEFIAYEVGSMIGFNMLRYDIAIDGEIMGCISESMINTENQELIEGVKYLQAYLPEFDPFKKEHKTWYTFDVIEKALEFGRLSKFLENVLELIVLDALIGNGDRHQENWAFIGTRRLFSDVYPTIIPPQRPSQIAIVKLLKHREEKIKATGQELPPSFYTTIHTFAPIYDSGSSLGRELLPEKIDQLLNSESELSSYINKGTSEIHWNDKKLSHFQLIRTLLDTPHKEKLVIILEKVVQKFDEQRVKDYIEKVDGEVPEAYASFRIPPTRKRLIFKIITLRFGMLRTLIYE
ncbi:MAG TPA: hypothetical protein VGM31_09020 [Puia sp.]